jgi:23S rRNA U2552 (ribose-2'-O)-methylase RlmE/FtsJ
MSNVRFDYGSYVLNTNASERTIEVLRPEGSSLATFSTEDSVKQLVEGIREDFWNRYHQKRSSSDEGGR